MARHMTREQLREHRQEHDKSNSWWLRDARGIECCRVCDTCEAAAIAEYRPEIFDVSQYDDVVEEQIEAE